MASKLARPRTLAVLFGVYFLVMAVIAAWAGASLGYHYTVDITRWTFTIYLLVGAIFLVGIGLGAAWTAKTLDARIEKLSGADASDDEVLEEVVVEETVGDDVPPPLEDAPAPSGDHVDRDIDELLVSLQEMEQEAETVEETEPEEPAPRLARAARAGPAAEAEARQAETAPTAKPPKGYEDMTVAQIAEAAPGWRRPNSEAALAYEREHAGRKGAIAALPEVPPHEDVSVKSVTGIFNRSFVKSTLLICTSYFLVMLSFYFLLNWTPKVLVDQGMSVQIGISGAVLMNAGGVIGGLLMGWFAGLFGLRRLSSLFMVMLFVSVAVFCFADAEVPVMAAPVATLGLFMIGVIARPLALGGAVDPPQGNTVM